jgi:hypothetical protein
MTANEQNDAVPSQEELTTSVAEYYAALAGEGKDRDGHWSIAERWSYGEHLGWFVEHNGYGSNHLGVDDDDGPYLTPEKARRAMAARLRAAIAAVEGRVG